jgi:hypothetical protein
VDSCFSEDEQQRKMAREFVSETLANAEEASGSGDVFASAAACTAALEALEPSPEHMLWFEYNFLYVLCAGGRPDPAAMGSHTVEGYAQRARFYSISDAGRLLYSKRVAEYLNPLRHGVCVYFVTQ